MIAESIQRAVHDECSRPGAALGLDFYNRHLVPVALYSAELAAKLGADPEVTAISAWLHDVSAVLDISTLPRHAELSADHAVQMLRERSVAPHRIELISTCIRSHSTPLPIDSHPIEAVILSNADAMAQIAEPVFWTHFAFGIRHLSFEDGRRWLASLVESKYSALIEPARAIVATHCARACAIFSAYPPRVPDAG